MQMGSSLPLYLDYNATTPIDPQVFEVMRPFLEEHFGNPSCAYKAGQVAKKAVEKARKQVAALLNCSEREIVFTSGGTESNNQALLGGAWALKNRGNHIITSQIEHPSVLKACRFLEGQGFKLTCLPVDSDGWVDPESLKKALTKKTILLSVMLANNEVGTLEPIEEIGLLAREREILFHCDAAQAVGKIAVDPRALSVDLLTLASHKFYGPKGVGALYIREGVEIGSLLLGAGQEGGRRAGTENVPSLVGMGKACELARKELSQRTKTMAQTRDLLEKLLRQEVEEVRVNGHPQKRLPNTLSMSFKGLEAHRILEKILHRVAVSPGAACHGDGKVKASHVLEAMKVAAIFSHGTLRFSTGKDTTPEKIEKAAEIIIRAVKDLRKALSPKKKTKE